VGAWGRATTAQFCAVLRGPEKSTKLFALGALRSLTAMLWPVDRRLWHGWRAAMLLLYRDYVDGHDITAVERAFQLARSSACTCVKDIKERLMAEGYAANQISGRVLSKQLAALIKARHA
jgi:hypothetical protein